jgi:hypothetical protein
MLRYSNQQVATNHKALINALGHNFVKLFHQLFRQSYCSKAVTTTISGANTAVATHFVFLNQKNFVAFGGGAFKYMAV